MATFVFRSMLIVVENDCSWYSLEATKSSTSLARTRASKTTELNVSKATVSFSDVPTEQANPNSNTTSSSMGILSSQQAKRISKRKISPQVLEDVSEIYMYLQRHNCHNIKELWIRPKETVDETHIQILTDFVRLNYSHLDIEKLSLANAGLTSDVSNEIAKLVQLSLATLKEIDLSENEQLKTKGIQKLVEVLTSSEGSNLGSNSYNCSVSRLILSNIGLLGNSASILLSLLLRNNSTICDLNLAHNSIGNKGIKTLASSFCYNHTLETLNLAQNKIKDLAVRELIDGLVADKADQKLRRDSSSLTQLDLSGNNIGPIGAGHIANALHHARLKNLKIVDVSLNQIGAEGGIAIAAGLEKSITLGELNLSQNQIGDGVINIAKSIRRNQQGTRIAKLDLSLNSISDEGCYHLAAMLRDNTSIQQLNLANNAITDIGMTHLAKALFDNATLSELDISGNQMKDPKPFINLICHYDPQYGGRDSVPLRVLKYENNNFSVQDEERLSFAVHQFHKNKETWLKMFLQQIYNGTLRMLNLWSYEHSDEEIIALTNHLRKQHIQKNVASNLTNVFLGCPRLTDQGIHAFAAYVFECNHVKQVMPSSTSGAKKTTIGSSVQGMYIKDCLALTVHGLTSVSHALMRNRTLRILSISNCNVDEHGAKLLYNGLKTNTTLQRLTLENNRINDNGAKYILRLIQKHEQKPLRSSSVGGRRLSSLSVTTPPLVTSLNSISISKNGISDIAMQYLKPKSFVLSLKELYLHTNQISDFGAQSLANAFDGNATNLLQLNVASNYLTPDGIQVLKRAVPPTAFIICDRQNEAETLTEDTE
jgi:Ran GTPase-activating protein (RanGAP) involved in mRNA processing and transport